MNTKNRTFVLLLVLVLGMVLSGCAGTLQAQSVTPEPPAAAIPGSVTVVGQGTAYGQPDRATVVVGVETFAPTVSEATAQNQESLEGVMAALEEAGIPAGDIQTTNYSLYAEQIYGDRGAEGIAGYRVSNQVNVTIRDISQVGDVLEAVTEAGANAIYGINFSVADLAALEEEARAAAMADAAARAQSLADLGGVELGSIRVISEVIGQPGMPLLGVGGAYAVAESAAAPGISPGQLSYQVQVQVTYGLN